MSELRLFPRIQTQLQAEVSNDSGEQMLVKVRNISPGGLMLDGDLAFKEMISAESFRGAVASPLEVSICCRFPDDPIPFRSRCRLVFVRRLSQLEFNFGFRFVSTSAGMASRLERYVSATLGTKTVPGGRAEGL